MVAVYLRWTGCRAALHRGWWLVTSVYLVLDAGLSPSQLVLVTVAQGAVALTAEVPAGVVADTLSRKWSLVVSQLLMGTAMIATGLVTGFPALLLTQMLWGLAWTFASGADVAWITDELADPDRVPAVLTRAGRADLAGAAVGMVGFGMLASLTGRSAAMVLAGAGAVLLGLYVVRRFPERRFRPAPARARWATARTVLVRGFSLVRRRRAIRVMLVATLLVNGAVDAAGRLLTVRLIDLGFPMTPLASYTALSVLALLAGVAALRAVEARIHRAETARQGYALACAAGAVGLVGLAAAPDPLSGSIAVLLFSGIARPLTRTLGTIWVNGETTGDVRATVHSVLAQAEYTGAILGGAGVALVARLVPLPGALIACALLYLVTILVIRTRPVDNSVEKRA
ncbi:MAG TPA: MFS transporter [Actinoplanes sp.]|nr:MFS transporter [Actinoplanes sp.]